MQCVAKRGISSRYLFVGGFYRNIPSRFWRSTPSWLFHSEYAVIECSHHLVWSTGICDSLHEERRPGHVSLWGCALMHLCGYLSQMLADYAKDEEHFIAALKDLAMAMEVALRCLFTKFVAFNGRGTLYVGFTIVKGGNYEKRL